MKIAITGGSGGVGRAVTQRALAEGHGVVGIDRVAAPPAGADSNVTFIQLDITDYAAFESALRGCDALIHLGAIPAPGEHPDQVIHNNNVVGSYNALRAAVEVGITRVVQASSVNAIGLAYSRSPRFDYFPLDEQHPNYSEEPYSLSKWICEQQGDAFARRYENMTIASLRFHWVVPDREFAGGYSRGENGPSVFSKGLWGYVRSDATARACLLGLTPKFTGHEAFYITAPDTCLDEPSLELAQRFFPHVPVRGDLSGTRSFFACAKAERLLGWKHEE